MQLKFVVVCKKSVVMRKGEETEISIKLKCEVIFLLPPYPFATLLNITTTC
jgi:hypothetical protein